MFDLDTAEQPSVYDDGPSHVTPLSEDEDTMQAYVEGKWHRRFLHRSETACGIPYHSQFTTPRRESLEGPLCGDCFTIREMRESKRLEHEKYGDRDVIDDEDKP